MNRLFELQEAAGDLYSPQNNDAASNMAPPSAAAAGNDDNETDNRTGTKSVTFTGLDEAEDPNNNNRMSTSAAIEMTSREDAYVVTNDEHLDAALKLIEEIQAGNRKIQATTMELKLQTAQNMKNFNPAADADEGAEKVETLMDTVSATSKEVKAKLDELAEETKKLQVDEETAAANAGTIKIQQNQYNHLSRTFMQAINEYNSSVGDNEKQLRDQAVRRIKLKYTKADGSTVSDDEARQMAAQVLEFGRTDMLFQASKETLAQVLETRQDILRIERSMRELKQIMDDLSALINEQGEVMDQVLTNVQTSVQYMKSGREQLKKAREYAKSSSSKMKYIVCCFAVLFIIILAIVLGATIPV